MAVIIKTKKSCLTSVPSYKNIPVLFVEKWSLVPRFLAATGRKESFLLIAEAAMFAVCFYIFRMIAGQGQTFKEKSSFFDCLTHEDEGSAVFRNVGKHLPDDRTSHTRRRQSTATRCEHLSSKDCFIFQWYHFSD